MTITTGDYVRLASSFAEYITGDVVSLVNQMADHDDERSIGPLRILHLMSTAYNSAVDDTAPDWNDYLMSLPRVGSKEPKIKASEWAKIQAERNRNSYTMCEYYYTQVTNANGTTTLKVKSFYENACEMVKAGKPLSDRLSELEKTMGKTPVKSNIPQYNNMNPMERANELAYLTARVKGLRNKVKLAVRVGQQMLDIQRLLPDVNVNVHKTQENTLSPNANPMILEDSKVRANWETMTIGNFLRLNPQEAYDTLDQYQGDQWAALKATLGRERDDNAKPVIVKDDMTADITEKAMFKLAQWLESAGNRTALNKLRSDKDTGATVRRSIAMLYNNLTRVMSQKEILAELDKMHEESDATDTRVLAGGSKS
jgi:hypothetical protein